MIQASDPAKKAQPQQKYYVQSGESRWTMLATTPGVAALRLIQKTFEPAVKSRQKITGDLKMIDRPHVERLAKKLGRRIHVWEAGFGTNEAGLFDTDQIIDCWLKQMTSIENLLRKMAVSG